MSVTAEQSRAALKKANAARTFQAEMKRRMREHDRLSGLQKVVQIINETPPELGSMRVEALLRSVTKIGDSTVQPWLRRAQISPTRRLRDLTDNERERLRAALR